MRVTIHYNGRYEDTLVFKCKTIEEARKIAADACSLRDWDERDCWSEVEDDV